MKKEVGAPPTLSYPIGTLDLTGEQFRGGEVLAEPTLVARDFIHANFVNMKPDLRDRLALLRRAVAEQLGVPYDPDFLASAAGTEEARPPG